MRDKIMISYLEGSIKSVDGSILVIKAGSIGYAVQVPVAAQFIAGDSVELHIQMHWHQENGPQLFGFDSELAKQIFNLVISCSGLGPKIALALLADLGPERFLDAIGSGDERALSSVTGIGAKKAEQMIVQLKHKVSKLLESGIKIEGAHVAQRWQTISEVLTSLNYSKQEISGAIRYLSENSTNTQASFDQLMRNALSFLAKRT